MIHTKDTPMTEDDERALIDAIHRAIHMQRGRIKADVMGKKAPHDTRLPPAVTNRWERLMERLRLSLINAKTESQARQAIMMIFARSGGRVGIKELRDSTARDNVHRLLFHGDWQKARDLAMLAVVSFTAPAKTKSSRDNTESDQETQA